MNTYGLNNESRSGRVEGMMGDMSRPSAAQEGGLTKAIERQTAKIPSDVFLLAAGGAMILSAALQLRSPKRMTLFSVPSRQGQISNFVGQWVPTILMLGLYNKIVKVAGSDKTSS